MGLSGSIACQIYEKFGHEPTLGQKKVVEILGEYIQNGDNHSLMILNGYAGTGKTTIISALIGGLKELGISFFVMAPTGRAAKVVSGYSGMSSSTIHRKIYRQKAFGANGGKFELDLNKSKNSIFIVDEASMLANNSEGESIFGSGMLLDDLVEYVRSGDNNRLIFVGDDAQLPPVGLTISPALDKDYMERYGEVYYCTLNEVVRGGQGKGSAILQNATNIREMIERGELRFPKFVTAKDVKSINGMDLIEEIDGCYRDVGRDETIILTRSNKRAVEYNRGIRRAVLDIEDELASGDLIMVVKNNYSIAENDNDAPFDFIANGDTAVVERVLRHHDIYGFRFATVILRFMDYGDYRVECKVLLDALYSDAPSLTRAQNEKLFREIEKDYADIPQQRKRYKMIMESEYWGALQIKFAYGVTCHKSQGGQWSRVFIDRLIFGDEPITRDFQRWLYTAVTRCTERLYFVNWPEGNFGE